MHCLSQANAQALQKAVVARRAQSKDAIVLNVMQNNDNTSNATPLPSIASNADAMTLCRAAVLLSTPTRPVDEQLTNTFHQTLAASHPLVRLRARHSFASFARFSPAADKITTLIPQTHMAEVNIFRYINYYLCVLILLFDF